MIIVLKYIICHHSQILIVNISVLIKSLLSLLSSSLSFWQWDRGISILWFVIAIARASLSRRSVSIAMPWANAAKHKSSRAVRSSSTARSERASDDAWTMYVIHKAGFRCFAGMSSLARIFIDVTKSLCALSLNLQYIRNLWLMTSRHYLRAHPKTVCTERVCTYLHNVFAKRIESPRIVFRISKVFIYLNANSNKFDTIWFGINYFVLHQQWMILYLRVIRNFCVYIIPQ